MLNPNFEPHPLPGIEKEKKAGRRDLILNLEIRGSVRCPAPPFLEEEIVLLQGCGGQFGLDGRGMYGRSDATCTQRASYASEG